MKTKIFLSTVLSLSLLAIFGVSASDAQVSTTRVTTRQVQRLITRIETKIEVLKDEADRVATRTGGQNQTSTNSDELGRYLDELNTSVTRLDDTFDGRQPVDSELRDAMSDATVVDHFMSRNRVSVSAQAQWRSLKRDFNTLASYNRLSWNWNQTIPGGSTEGGYPGGSRPYIVTDAQLSTLISQIQNKTELFEQAVMADLNNSRTGVSRDSSSMRDNILALETSTLRLKQRVDSRQSTGGDVSDVLTQATTIDRVMSRNDLSYQSESQWRNLRADLNNLASAYRVSWDWNQTQPTYPGNNGPGSGRRLDTALSGTYRLNTNLSEDVSAAVDRALGTYATSDQQQHQRLERRLRSPDMIAIEKNNASVSMASSNLPRVTFTADGVARTETNQNGRTITTTATADADSLIVNYQGERASDFYVTFAPMNDGRLKVTRRIYLENSNTPVSVSSIYDKVDSVARWNMVTTGADNTSTGVINDTFTIPNGTRLNAVLRAPLTTSASQSTDRITLEVTTPSQYRGALITGRVFTEDGSSRTAGQSRVLVSFDSVRLSNGQSYRFGGVVNGVISAEGDNISVTQQTPARQTRAGVGDILGALIGAISGQPISQTATTGIAGSVLVQSRDLFSLGAGSQFIITANSETSLNQLR